MNSSSGTRRAGAVLLLVCGCLAAARPGRADVRRLAERLEAMGLESIRVDSLPDGCRVRLENRRFRQPGCAFGVIATLAAEECPGECRIVLERQGCEVAQLEFLTSDFLAMARGEAPADGFFSRLKTELLPDVPRGDGPARSSAVRRVDVTARVTVDSQIGHIQEPFMYHVEISPEASTQPWRGALLRLGWAFPIQHEQDIPPDYTRPDYHQSRPEEAVLFQYVRLGGHTLGSAGLGYFDGNRYGISSGLGRVFSDRLYVEASADVSVFVVFRPDVEYSSLSRVTFAAAAVYHFERPDFSLGLRGGRYLYGRSQEGAGEPAIRADATRKFGQTEIGFFAVDSQTSRFGGVRIVVPLPPSIRLRPMAIRPTVLANFPLEYKTDEGLFQIQPVDPRLRSALLDDLWPGSLGAQWRQWIEGYAYAGGGRPVEPR
jgi:hypothetical protein